MKHEAHVELSRSRLIAKWLAKLRRRQAQDARGVSEYHYRYREPISFLRELRDGKRSW